jgi:hypothetical protein
MIAVEFVKSPNAVDIRFETVVIRDGSISGTTENAIALETNSGSNTERQLGDVFISC